MPHTANTLLLDERWDIFLTESGDIAVVTGEYATAQNVANACRLFTNDAYFAQDEGIPWFVAQLGRPLARSVTSSRVRSAASDVEGVASVDAVNIEDVDMETWVLTGDVRFTMEGGADVSVDL
jgi:hypothetical protein|nr:MAG TPA: Protein of unknown function (DUF2634) [Caudoviricetes sp.]